MAFSCALKNSGRTAGEYPIQHAPRQLQIFNRTTTETDGISIPPNTITLPILGLTSLGLWQPATFACKNQAKKCQKCLYQQPEPHSNLLLNATPQHGRRTTRKRLPQYCWPYPDDLYRSLRQSVATEPKKIEQEMFYQYAPQIDFQMFWHALHQINDTAIKTSLALVSKLTLIS